MAQQVINVGAAPNDGTGNTIRQSFTICNNNFSELYSRAQTSPPPTLVGQVGDFAGMYAYDSTYFYYCFANYDGSSIIWAQVTQIGNIALSTIYNANSSVAITGPNGNVDFQVNGVANVLVVTSTGAEIAGNLVATGNLSGTYIFGNGSQLTGMPELYGNANVAAYLPTYTGNLSANNISTTNSLSTTGIISAAGNIVTSGYFVGDVFGNITGNFVVPGANTEVIYNTNGNADASPGLTFDSASNLLTVSGNVQSGNLRTTGLVSATGNVTGGNIRTAGLISATGNISGNYFIGNGSQLSGLPASYGDANVATLLASFGSNTISTTGTVTSGNITGGNILTAGLISATGNITGNFILGNGSQLTGIITSVSNLVNGTSNVDIATANSNVTVSVNATSNVVVFATTGQFTTGLISATGDIIGGNITTAGLASATGNVTGGNINTAGVVSATGNVTGGNINTAGVVSATGNISGGNITTAGLLSATGNIDAGNISLSTSGRIYTNGNIAAGTQVQAATLVTNVGNGGVAMLNGGGNGVGNIGNATGYFNTLFATATTALYADLAECYLADQSLDPGTVVMFGGTKEITECNNDMCEKVAGVVSTQPAYQMNSGLSGDHVTAVALIGRVPCKVQGSVERGALMVSAGNGRARAEKSPVMGSVIGKALQSFDGDTGTIEIVVGRL